MPTPRRLGTEDPLGIAPTSAAAGGVLAGQPMFLNRREAVGFPPDWRAAGASRLWRYHLHNHEFLRALPYEPAKALVLDWVDRHRPGPGQVGWEPYPLSLRIPAWCLYFFGLHRDRTLADTAFRDTLWASVVEQAEVLRARPERHLLGNHLLENGAALALAGGLVEHPAARRWLAEGLAILACELPEQVLADGGHIERSPMYQARLLGVLLRLERIGGAVGALVRPYRERLATALATMTHPDGDIALLNDSALGMLPMSRALLQRAGVPPSPDQPFALPETGYYGARTGRGHYVICDAGPLGPDYQPGHGHADLFSFELSLHGARVVVDSGVCTYDVGRLRDYCRSTRAHNTVEIEGHDQVELWAAFRVGRRCRPQGVRWRRRGGGFELAGRHHGYRHLRGRPVHARALRWLEGGRLEIRDRVTARRPVRSVARLHLHPACRIADWGRYGCTVRHPGGRAEVRWTGWAQATPAASCYCPEFGRVQPNPCLEWFGAATRLDGEIVIEAA